MADTNNYYGGSVDEKTKISYTNVADAVRKIKLDRDAIDTILKEFTSAIGQSTEDDVFDGKAKVTFVDNFDELKKSFDLYIQKLDDFCNIITYANESTKSTEEAMSNLAEQLRG